MIQRLDAAEGNAKRAFSGGGHAAWTRWLRLIRAGVVGRRTGVRIRDESVHSQFVVNRVVPILIAVATVCGCSPAWYKQSADEQVDQILRNRKKLTLDYEPQTEAATTVDPKPTKKSYAQVPTTPLAPPGPPPLEPLVLDRRYGPLGPEELFPPGQDSPRHTVLSPEATRAPAIQRLTLGPPVTVPPGNVMDLFDALAYAVQNSRDYSTQMEDTYLAALEVTLARHLFGPRPFARSTVQYVGGQTSVDYRSAFNMTNVVGVRQQLPYGGEIVAQGLVGFVQSLNDAISDAETAEAAISATIPLLRGAGMVNLEPLISSERNLIYEIRQFEDFRRAFAVRVASSYLRLLSAQLQISNRRLNYLTFSALTEQTEALYAAGRINFLQVQRALQSELQAENNLIDALDAYDTALDAFKLLLGMPVEEPLQVVLIDLDVATPSMDEDATALALRYRLDLQTTRDQVDDARRQVEVAKNRLLPDLNFSVDASMSNLNGTPASRIEPRGSEYSAEVFVDFPLDRVAERNVYRRSLINLERAQRDYVQTQDEIVAGVRQSVRAIRSAEATLEIQRQQIELNRRRLDYATELLVQGRANNSQDAVDAQNSLLQAQDQYARAKADLQIQILQLLRDTGTLRVDPAAGTLGHVMDRAAEARAWRLQGPATQPAPINGG